MARKNLIRRPDGKYADAADVRTMLGLGDRIPKHFCLETEIQGIKVCVLPAGELLHKTNRPHRVCAECPDCRQWVSAGRLHQHVGSRACVSNIRCA